MKTNLLLLDSYKNIEDIIHFAFSFNNRLNHKLKIFYVMDFNWMRHTVAGSTAITGAGIAIIEESLHKEYDEAESKIRDVVSNYLKKNSVNFPIDINVSKNNRIDIINNELEKNPELMVLISNYQNYSEITGGLVSYSKLIERVKCPVLVIPDKNRDADVHNIVYASNYNPEDIHSLKELSNYFKQSDNTSITVLHNEHDFNFKEELQWTGFKNIVQSEVNEVELNFELKRGKDFITGMEEYAEEKNPDLLVLMKGETGFFEELFSRNNTKNVITHFDKPVMVYH